MSFEEQEQELRSRLAETAALAAPPQFSGDDLAARARRIRRRRRQVGAGALVSMAAVALAIAIPLARVGAGEQLIHDSPPQSPPGPSYAVTVNGQTRAVPTAGGRRPLFTVSPGRRLTISVRAVVPEPRPIAALWLGITNGILSGHANMTPILAASTRKPLRPGPHQFVLHWTVPAGMRPGDTRQLSVELTWPRPKPAMQERVVVLFAVPVSGRAASAQAVTHRLRVLAEHSAAICDGARSASMLAVRTTFGKATAVLGQGQGIADKAADPVYLLLMRGGFTLYNGGSAPFCSQTAGRYFVAIVDAATFLTHIRLIAGRSPHH
jgi:hypothetical protein